MTATEYPRKSIRARAQRNFLLTALVAFLAGAVGAAFGASVIVSRQESAPPSLHAMVHEGLELSLEQERALEDLETAFAARRGDLEARLADANQALATAIEAHTSYSPEVGQAVDEFHEAMDELQRATIRHVYDMRAILTDEQAVIFDRRIARALTGSFE